MISFNSYLAPDSDKQMEEKKILLLKIKDCLVNWIKKGEREFALCFCGPSIGDHNRIGTKGRDGSSKGKVAGETEGAN